MSILKSGNKYEIRKEHSPEMKDAYGNTVFLQISMSEGGPTVNFDSGLLQLARKELKSRELLLQMLEDAKEVFTRETSQ